MSAQLIGLDVGTTSVRGALITADGSVLAIATRPLDVNYPAPARAEQDPPQILAAVDAVLAELAAQATDLRGLSVCGAAVCAALVDDDDVVLGPSVLWMDTRAREQAERGSRSGDPILARYGGQLSAEWMLPKAAYMLARDPRADRARRIVDMQDVIVHHLTGRWVLSEGTLVGEWCYDAATQAFPSTLMDELGLDVGRLGWDVPVLAAGEPVGQIRPELSARLGLPEQLIVGQGVMDSYATALAGNIYRPGQLVASIGTSSSYVATTSRLTCDGRLLGPIEGILPGLGPVQRGGQTSAAGAIAWFRQTFAPTRSYAELDALAAVVPPGARGVGAVESLHGSRTPHRNPAATGMFSGLTLGHGQAELFRAMLEAVAFGGRSVVDALTEAGCETEQVLAVGGAMRSSLWRQIHADVLGMQLRTLATDQPVCLGAAMCAAAAGGVVASLADAAATMSRAGEIIEPDRAAVEVYRQLFPDYARRAAFMAGQGDSE